MVIQDPCGESAIGRRVLQGQQSELATQVRRLHGNSALWVGETFGPAQLLKQCMVRDAVFLHSDIQRNTTADAGLATVSRVAAPLVQGQLEALPFANHQFGDGVTSRAGSLLLILVLVCARLRVFSCPGGEWLS